MKFKVPVSQTASHTKSQSRRESCSKFQGLKTCFFFQMSGSGIDYFSGVGNNIRDCFYTLFSSYTCSPWGKMSENNEATLYILKLQDGKWESDQRSLKDET